MRSRKRILLLAVAGLLSASALLAIAILLVGRFGETEGRILATTGLLAGYGLAALPSTILLDQRRWTALALGSLLLAVVGALLALAAVWGAESDALANSVGTVTAFALGSTQVAALAARRRERDSTLVRRLFALSCALVTTAAAMFTTLLWAEIERESYVRALAALVVLDLLVVALQPLLALVRPVGALHRLRIVAEPGETLVMEVEAADLAAAAGKAIRTRESASSIRLSLRASLTRPSRARRR